MYLQKEANNLLNQLFGLKATDFRKGGFTIRYITPHLVIMLFFHRRGMVLCEYHESSLLISLKNELNLLECKT